MPVGNGRFNETTQRAVAKIDFGEDKLKWIRLGVKEFNFSWLDS